MEKIILVQNTGINLHILMLANTSFSILLFSNAHGGSWRYMHKVQVPVR